jgi:hypothetical protein
MCVVVSRWSKDGNVPHENGTSSENLKILMYATRLCTNGQMSLQFHLRKPYYQKNINHPFDSHHLALYLSLVDLHFSPSQSTTSMANPPSSWLLALV